jgi:xylulokinase
MARGVFFGLSLRTRREQLSRAVLESVAFGNRQLLEIAEGMTGEAIREVLAIGGWSLVDDWNRIKADVTGRTLRPLDLAEAAVAGAALLGGMASGTYANFSEAASKVVKTFRSSFAPDGAARAAYEKRYSVYTELYPRLKDLYQR